MKTAITALTVLALTGTAYSHSQNAAMVAAKTIDGVKDGETSVFYTGNNCQNCYLEIDLGVDDQLQELLIRDIFHVAPPL